MLLLQFQAGKDRYGLDIAPIIEVIPMVFCRPLPHADPAVAGLFNYHGTMVPVIDLTILLTGEPSCPLFSTRIIMVDYQGRDDQNHPLGLLAERVTETVFYRKEDLQPAGIAVEGASYLGDLLIQADGGMIQHITIERLLPPSLQATLFPAAGEA